MCILFNVHNTFPRFGQVSQKTKKSTTKQISDMIEQLGDNFNLVMTSYFKDLKKAMEERSQIPVSLMEKHAKDVSFLVDTNFTCVQFVVLRIRWLRALPYEVDVDETSTTITTLLAEDIDQNAQAFRTYEEAKARITTTLQTTTIDRKKNKMMKRLIEEFGEGDKEDGKDIYQQG